MNDLLLIALVTLNIIITIVCTLLLKGSITSIEKNQERLERSVKEEIANNRQEAGISARQGREEFSGALKTFTDTFLSRMTEIAILQKNQLDAFAQQLSVLTRMNEQKLDKVKETVEDRLKMIQSDNSQKLEQMRMVVDEKLHSTLEKRLGESFKLVSDRLELVHKGLGEMQNLASGVGDLKKVLVNVKTRGIWGEVQLENLLEQTLTPDQYAKNVVTKKNSSERVEFAIRLPAKNGTDGVVWMPIDAKFPLEDYQRLLEAQDRGDKIASDEMSRALDTRIKSEARDIRDKYLDPPNTTDFGLLFLPVEGLYAEVLRRPGLSELLQRDFRIIIAGPTTLAALLNSLQMGFKTLAVEKRSSEVWSLLGVVKSEFGKFGDILDKTQKKLREASNTIEDAAKKSRNIERKLKNVEELPVKEAPALLEEN